MFDRDVLSWLKDLSGQMVFFNPVCALYNSSSTPLHPSTFPSNVTSTSQFLSLPLCTHTQQYLFPPCDCVASAPLTSWCCLNNLGCSNSTLVSRRERSFSLCVKKWSQTRAHACVYSWPSVTQNVFMHVDIIIVHAVQIYKYHFC